MHVEFRRGTEVLGAPDIMVPMRVAVDVAPGPFSIVVNGKRMLSGSVAAGQVASGSDGDNCPADR
ncbi:MAG TPA: hypothetical protein VMI11_04660 [Actinomycetes bacterium]|nr:hypothetical protein [Actinomycetes bacterium]